MMAINDITGDTIASKHLSGDAKRRFDESFDRMNDLLARFGEKGTAE